MQHDSSLLVSARQLQAHVRRLLSHAGPTVVAALGVNDVPAEATGTKMKPIDAERFCRGPGRVVPLPTPVNRLMPRCGTWRPRLQPPPPGSDRYHNSERPTPRRSPPPGSSA